MTAVYCMFKECGRGEGGGRCCRWTGRRRMKTAKSTEFCGRTVPYVLEK